jgi:hypothetical protein
MQNKVNFPFFSLTHTHRLRAQIDTELSKAGLNIKNKPFRYVWVVGSACGVLDISPHIYRYSSYLFLSPTHTTHTHKLSQSLSHASAHFFSHRVPTQEIVVEANKIRADLLTLLNLKRTNDKLQGRDQDSSSSSSARWKKRKT